MGGFTPTRRQAKQSGGGRKQTENGNKHAVEVRRGEIRNPRNVQGQGEYPGYQWKEWEGESAQIFEGATPPQGKGKWKGWKYEGAMAPSVGMVLEKSAMEHEGGWTAGGEGNLMGGSSLGRLGSGAHGNCAILKG